MLTRIRLGERLTAHPVAGVALLAVLTGALAWPIWSLEIRDELGDYWQADDPGLARFEAMLDTFDLESEGGGVVAVELAASAFTHENLERVASYTRAIERLDSVSYVLSLTNAPSVLSSDDDIEVASLVPDPIPDDPAALAAIEAAARADPDIAGRLVSEDARATAIVVATPPSLPYGDQLRLGDALYALARASEAPGVRLHVTGAPAFLSVFHHLTRHEIATLYPVVVLAMVALLWASFRDARAVVVPLGVAALATLWTIGALAGSGRFLNSSTVAIPAVVVVISLADTIHIINQYFETVRRRGDAVGLDDRRALMAETLDRIWLPCFLTTVTTGVGFLSLLLVEVPVIQDIGRFAGFGVVAAFVVSMVLVPACYLVGPLPTARATGVQVSGWIGRLLDGATRLVLGRPRSIVVGTAIAFFGIGIAGATRLEVDFHWKEFVKERHAIREAIRFVDARLGGYDWVSIVVALPADAPGDLLAADRMQAIEAMQQAVVAEPFVATTTSIVNPIRLANQAFHGGDPAYHSVPEDRRLVAQYLLLYEFGAPRVIDAVLSVDRRQALISARLRSPGDRAVRDWMARLGPTLDQAAARAGLSYEITGFATIMSQLNVTVSRGLTASLLAATVVIALVMTVALRSVRLGLVSIIPNGIPVLMTLGAMGWLGIPLSGQTAMIGSVSVGLAVDDTIHFLHRFRRELDRSGGDRRRAAALTIHSTGRAIVFTSLVLAAGFGTFLFSAFVQYTEFGLLTGVTMLTAVLGDLLLLPVLLVAFPGLTRGARRAADDRSA